MKKFSLVLAVLCTFLIAGAASAFDEVEDYYKKMPGYIDFGELGDFDESEEAVEVLIKAPLLKLVMGIAERDEPELAELLRSVKLIKVNVFQIDSSGFEKFSEKAADIEKRMRKKGWEAIVRAKESGERAYVYLKYDEEEIAGITVIALEEDGEAAFVNIVGAIDLETLSQLSGSFSIPEMDFLEDIEDTDIDDD